MKKIPFILFLTFLLPIHPAAAKPNPQIIAQVEAYLNGIKCLVAEFIQTNPDHSQVMGKIWIKRESKNTGKMRLEYPPEVGQRLLAKKDELIVYDLKDHSESRYNLDYTPAAFILRPNINLNKDVTVESIHKRHNFIEVILVPKGDATEQSLTLYFSLYDNGNIKGLQQWVVKDPQGNQTLVQFIPEKTYINDPELAPEAIFNP